MLTWKLERLTLPLGIDWKISRNTSSVKINFIVTVRDDDIKGQGEVAPNIRFDETPDKIAQEFDEFLKSAPSEIEGIDTFIQLMNKLEISNCLKFGLESALVEYIARSSGESIASLLGLKKTTRCSTMYSVPIMSAGEIKSYIEKKNLGRFGSLKIKIDMNSAYETIPEIQKYYSGRLCLDANEAFDNPDNVCRLFEKVKTNNIEFIEQPLPASMHTEHLELKKSSPVKIFADESIIGGEITEYHQERFHGVNIKLMKSGGYLKALKQFKSAEELGLLKMIGCMIETSIGISSALPLTTLADYVDLDGFLLLESDPFGLLAEENGEIFSSDFH
jgi:L-alanine-DL-glutamate epimerase-like enolase superfamily enzyme